MSILANMLLVSSLVFAGQAEVESDFSLPSVLSSGCVLQRNARVPIWGKGAPGYDVSVQVSWSGKTYSGQVRPSGDWWIPVPTPDAGGPYSIALRCRGTDVLIEDILIGEVWLCSGQSNMEMPIGAVSPQYSGVENFESELKSADLPSLRLFDVADDEALVPSTTCGGTWQACTPESAREFSATAYFFGKELQRELDVPIGLISAAVGGTRVESWMSASTLRKQSGFQLIGELLADAESAPDILAAAQTVAVENWFEEIVKRNTSQVPVWKPISEATADSEWKGVLQLQFAVALESPALAGALTLQPGAGTVWFSATCNGEEFAAQLPTLPLPEDPAPLPIPSRLLREGDNVFSLCVLGGTARQVLDDLRSRISLGEQGALFERDVRNWKFAPGLHSRDFPRFPEYDPLGHNTPTALFNAMIAPVMPFKIRGAIWYQGESNTDRSEQYRDLFPALIADWRGWWRQGDFPFYFVQIAPYRYPLSGESVARLRDAQRAALDVGNTGMAVTLDVGDPTDIHPKDKQSVGHRLALWALAKDYGKKDLVYCGPLDAGLEIVGDSLRVRFDHVNGGLMASAGGLREFEVAGADGVFHPARASIDGEVVVVQSELVRSPVAVRYCWSAAAVGTLFNRAGLPASAFERR